MFRHKRLVGLAAAALLLTTAACGGSSDSGGGSDGKGDLKIAFMGILTGPAAQPDQTKALDLAVKEINADGGILGRKVTYKAYDSNVTPQTAVTATNEALRDKPDAVMGYYVSATVAASGPALKRSGALFLNQSTADITSAKALGYDKTFRSNHPQELDSEVGAKFILDEFKPKQVGIIYSTDAANTGCFKVLESAFKKAGVKVVSRTTVYGATDETTQALGMKGSDAVAVCSTGDIISLAIKSLRQQGTNAPVLAMVPVNAAVTAGIVSKDTLSKGDIYQLSVGCDADAADRPESVKLRDAFAKAYPGIDLQTAAPGNYDALYLLKAAAEKANSTDPDKMAAALRELTYVGACGTFKSDSHQNMLNTLSVEKFSSDGKTSVETTITGDNSY